MLSIPQAAPVPAAAANAAGGDAPAAVTAVPVILQQDHDWDTQAWVIKAKALDDAFQAAHIPQLPNVYQTAVLRVEVVRQELMPSGAWGPEKPEKVLPDITTVPVQVLPSEATASKDDKAAFVASAAANAQAIWQPSFFGVVYGTQWYPPGTPKPDDVFAPPGVGVPGVPMPGVPGQVAPQPLTPRERPGLPPGAGVAMPRPGVIHGGAPPMPAPAVAPAAPPAGVVVPNRPYQPPIVAPAVPGGIGEGAVPGATAGFINPALGPDVTIYTHDWNVEPGHKYRYKMRYWISNPLFNVQQGNVKLADQNLLAIKSPDSAWTAPVEIASRYRFWVQKFQRNINNEVTFDLFTKKPGVPGGLERTTIRVTPGDTIGASPWLLVDVRPEVNRRNFYYFLVADPTGRVERHDLEHDSKDPDHLEMLDRTGAAAGVGG